MKNLKTSDELYKAIQIKEAGYWQTTSVEPEVEWIHYDKVFKPYLADNHFENVIDIGCGPAPYIFNDLVKCDTRTAVDPLIEFYASLERYQKWWNYSYPIACYKNIEQIPSKFFDAVFCLNCLDHVQDVGAMLDEIYRILAPNGYLFIEVDVNKPPDYMHPHSLSAIRLSKSMVPMMKTTLLESVTKSWKFSNDVFWYVGKDRR